MGSTLSTEQKVIVSQVSNVLLKPNVKFSKDDLKVLFLWVFKLFLGATAESVFSVEFWDNVGKTMYQLQTESDFQVGKFYPLFHSIYKVTQALGEGSKDSKSSVSLPLSPNPPDPAAPSPPPWDKSGNGNCLKQGQDRYLPSPVLSHPLS